MIIRYDLVHMLEQATHIHFIGIGGIGVSGLARLMVAQGKRVTGSDAKASRITQDLLDAGVEVFIGHDSLHVSESVSLVVYSSAIPETNVERVSAHERALPSLSYAEALGEFTKGFSTIVVTGTHGKSTTTSLLGLMLEAGGYDPTVLVGSMVPSFPQKNIRVGGGRFFVVEGCEYRANMLNLHPEMIVLTNIEEDHLDFYRDLDHIRETFQTFVDRLKSKGVVIRNANDAESMKLSIDHDVTYGLETPATYQGINRLTGSGFQSVHLFQDNQDLGELRLVIPGAYNVSNAVAATAAAMELGVPFDVCKRVAQEFYGIWRRFERVGVYHGVPVISDYAHHPTAVASTLRAAKEFFPDHRIITVFQPHQHSRTKSLFQDFVDVLQDVDVLILPDIYDVLGRNEEHDISSQDLVRALQERSSSLDVRYVSKIDLVEQELSSLVQSQDVVLIMGAGDIDSVARAIV